MYAWSAVSDFTQLVEEVSCRGLAFEGVSTKRLEAQDAAAVGLLDVTNWWAITASSPKFGGDAEVGLVKCATDACVQFWWTRFGSVYQQLPTHHEDRSQFLSDIRCFCPVLSLFRMRLGPRICFFMPSISVLSNRFSRNGFVPFVSVLSKSSLDSLLYLVARRVALYKPQRAQRVSRLFDGPICARHTGEMWME